MSNRRRTVVSLGIAAIAATLLATGTAAAAPPDPAVASATVAPPDAMYGSGLAAGDRVEVLDRAKSCGSTVADANGQWIVWIAATAPCRPEPGDRLSFVLNGSATSASERFKVGGAPADVTTGVRLTDTVARPTRRASRPGVPHQPSSNGAAVLPPDAMYGSGLRAGDRVEVFDGTRSCGSTVAGTSGQWIIWVAATAPCNPSAGDVLTFLLNGRRTAALERFKIGGTPARLASGVRLNPANSPR